MTTIRPRRSALYMPGANARALEKAKSLPADALLLDLEDAVAPEKKPEARAQIKAALESGGYDGREIVIRTNGLGTSFLHDDLVLCAQVKPDAVLVPKVSSARDVSDIRVQMSATHVQAQLWAMIETPTAILNIREIAAQAADPNAPLTCFIIGPNDLLKETRATFDENRTAGLYWMSATLTAARAYGVDVLDGVYNAFKDMDGYERECRHGKMLGFDGKSLIHPCQIDLANEIFAPDEEEVAWSRKVIAAFEDPENAGKGVITLDGRMVELLHAEMAKRTVALADGIAANAAKIQQG
jgi:citrate lyase subunit beta/citryl-CoA lyase